MWRSRLVVPALGGLLLLPLRAGAHDAPVPGGSLVDVDVQVDGRVVPLYSALDGSGRLYLEAREGSRYAISLRNRSGERVGVALSVDGLDVISGERTSAAGSGVPRCTSSTPGTPRRSEAGGPPCARSGSSLSWTSAPRVRPAPAPSTAVSGGSRWPSTGSGGPTSPARDSNRIRPAGRWSAIAAPMPPATTPRTPRRPAPRRRARRPRSGGSGPSSFPGTGWGPGTADQAVLVEFDPEARPSQLVTLRYEYADTLRSLGVLTASSWDRDRLRARELGSLGFARPPTR